MGDSVPFPDLKGQAPLRRTRATSAAGEEFALFLTSKVRLHCDSLFAPLPDVTSHPFPDLKGQAPLRPGSSARPPWRMHLFLTSKVRLHCDPVSCRFARCQLGCLFLTSKVRLHCDSTGVDMSPERLPQPFPDLKGQAPLRRLAALCRSPYANSLFLTSKVRLHCDASRTSHVP